MANAINHYLSVSIREKVWGLYVTGVGHAVIPPYGAYPPIPHPAGYHFQWERGRILEEYALVCLVQGAGTFESKHQKARIVHSGDCLILFPGEWHRYRPDASSGWEEYWLTFQGSLAEIWKRSRLIRTRHPLVSSGRQHLLIPLFEDMLRLTGPKSRSQSFEIAAICHLLIARAVSGQQDSSRASTYDGRLHEAGDYLRAHPETDIDLPKLAKYFGMSYSTFRRGFTKQFGVSPDRFHQQARVTRAKQLLIETNLPLKSIAEKLRYSSEFYLMQVFKRHTGLTPTQWRHQAPKAESQFD